MTEFKDKLKGLLNSVSLENGSDTPDFILAQYLCNCLKAFDFAVNRREDFYGRGKKVHCSVCDGFVNNCRHNKPVHPANLKHSDY